MRAQAAAPTAGEFGGAVDHDRATLALEAAAQQHAPLLVPVLALELKDEGVPPADQGHVRGRERKEGLLMLGPGN